MGRHFYFAKGRLRIQQVKFLARLEANSLARSDRDFRAGPRIAADSRLARADIEHAETAQLDPVAAKPEPFSGSQRPCRQPLPLYSAVVRSWR